MNNLSIEDQIQDSIANPGTYSGLPPGELPIGSVLPVFFPNYKLVIPDGWCVCAGQRIDDPASPFVNLNAPSLLDNRFPMGTKDAETYGKQGGANELAPQGDHSHSYAIRKAGTRERSPDGFQSQGDDCRTVTLQTSATGSHDHGGENRPRWFGLVYIFRYK